MKLAALYRYPIKGLSPEPLEAAALTAGGYFPGDRLFAIENGPARFDPAAPKHQPKIKFLMLMRHARLATLRTRFDDATGVLTIADADGRTLAQGDLGAPEDRAAIARFFADFSAEDLRGAPGVLAAPDGFRFTDSRQGFVSLINLASVADLAARMGRPLDPLRFRGNLHIDGLAPWAEVDLVGKTLVSPDGATLTVTAAIDRCAATEVDPTTGARDADVTGALRRAFGHVDCGVYAQVTAGGMLRAGDALRVG